MSDWVGFSDADLQKIKGKSDVAKPKILKPMTGGKPKSSSNLGPKQQRKNQQKPAAKHGNNLQKMPPGASLSKPSKPTVDESENVDVVLPSTPTDQIPLHGKSSQSIVKDETQQAQQMESEVASSKEPKLLEDVEVIQKKEKLQFEDIQKRQREMEEKNKRKKTLLTKAIAERKKKAFAESTKLGKIQAELVKLDEMLNYDVSILRDKIEEACHEYSHAKKRFEKAEVEYIAAKMNLHKATDMKDDLTEHLYNLIQLNEDRKAKKLEELMQKLELDDDISIPASANDSNQTSNENLKPVHEPISPAGPSSEPLSPSGPSNDVKQVEMLKNIPECVEEKPDPTGEETACK